MGELCKAFPPKTLIPLHPLNFSRLELSPYVEKERKKTKKKKRKKA
jgi:hypothetical protein